MAGDVRYLQAYVHELDEQLRHNRCTTRARSRVSKVCSITSQATFGCRRGERRMSERNEAFGKSRRESTDSNSSVFEHIKLSSALSQISLHRERLQTIQ